MYLYKLTHKISVFEQYWDKQKKFMLMEKPSRVLKENFVSH